MAKILMIDDEAIVRLVVSAMLRRFGHEVSTASDGEEGIKLFRQQHFDMVVTDVRMPGLNGPEVIKILRRLRPGIRVILIGGGGSIPPDATEAFAQEVGADRALQKPFGVQELNGVVSELLSDTRTA
jgi:DNA-binding NtrC family response regulator